MARLSTVRCPNCGANVRLEVAAEWVTCSYCKTEAYVQRPKAPPPPPAVAVVQAPEASSGARGVLLAAAGLALLAAGIVSVVVYQNSTLEDVAIQSPAMLFDVNRDGAKDALIAGLAVGQVNNHVRALDAHTGETLWQTDDLTDVRHGPEFALNDDAVLMFEGTKLIGIDARTGKQRFTQTLPERLESACEDENHFYIELADHRQFSVDPRSGVLTALPTPANAATAAACPPAWGTRWQAHGQFVRRTSWEGASNEELSPSFLLRYALEPTAVLVGVRAKGSRVPMLAGVTKDRWAWRLTLPANDPLNAEEGDPSGVTLTADRAYATYSFAQGTDFALVAIALSDGRHLWETRIPRKSDPGSLMLSADDKHVFISGSSSIYAVAASNGKLLWSLGWGLR